MLARYNEALRAMAEHSTDAGAVIKLGIPSELAPDVLPRHWPNSGRFPKTRVVPRHLSTAAQFAALRSDELDVGLVRERPRGPEFDAMLVAREGSGRAAGVRAWPRGWSAPTASRCTISANCSGWASRAPAARPGLTS